MRIEEPADHRAGQHARGTERPLQQGNANQHHDHQRRKKQCIARIEGASFGLMLAAMRTETAATELGAYGQRDQTHRRERQSQTLQHRGIGRANHECQLHNGCK